MKKEMSSFDVSSLVTEMAAFENAHMDKIYQWGSGNVLFRINTKNGKVDLYFKDRKWLYIPTEHPETPTTPTSFATYLRKYLDNARIGKTYQVGFDRMVVLEVFKSDGDYKIIFEMFGGGNVLLVKEGKIVNCLVQKNYRDRVTRPGEDYVMPKPRFNPFSSTEEEFSAEFKTSAADTVRTLATVNNLGGQYAEEVCKRAGCEKSVPASEVTDIAISELYKAMNSIAEQISKGSEPTIYRKDGHIIDIAPVTLSNYDDCVAEKTATISEAISKYLAEIEKEEIKVIVDPEIEKLKKRIAKQQETVEQYRQSSEMLKAQADSLYTEYQKVTELLTVLDQQSKRLSWEKLTEGALKIPFVDYIEPAKNEVAMKIGYLSIVLDYTKGIDANASDLYAKGKKESEKADNANKALNDSLVELEKKQKGFDKKKAHELTKAKPTKKFWFEVYKWFITSQGKLVIAGRDTRSNDSIVKKHMKEDHDIYAHADIHGAPSVILKDGLSASPEEYREACWFALSQSKAWMSGSLEGGSFWAYPDQVSKTPNAGEFVPKGAFIIRGKRNYEYHLPIELGIGEISYQGERKVMCAPTPVIENGCEKYIVIRPSKEKNGRISGDIAKMFEVPEEEISRIIPPGSLEIVKTVWPTPETDEEEDSEKKEETPSETIDQ